MAGLACSRLTLPDVRLRRERVHSKLPEAYIFRSDVTGILDEFAAEDEPLLVARANAEEIGGATPVAAQTGAALRFLAAAIGAKAVVEIGTGFGYSGIWLLRGMRPGSVLTSVDPEAEHHRLARSVFAVAGFPASRYRLITGRALEVLPRLADSAYDLVFCDADKREYPEYLEAAIRLLRPGGIVAFDHALWTDQGANVVLRDPDTTAVGETRELIGADDQLVPLMLPIGGGLLAAVKRPV
jgi:predicted O-methyltransferase YrrM